MDLPCGSGAAVAEWQNTHMDGKELKAARKAVGLTLEQVSEAIGLSVSQVSRIEGNTRVPRVPDLQKMLELYKQPPLAFQSSGAAEKALTREVSAPFVLPPDSDVGMPIFGSAFGGADGAIMFDGDPVEWIKTPDYLVGVKRSYGVYVQGESMVPRLFPGNRLDVHPSKPPKRNDVVVIQLKPNAPGEPFEVYVKAFERRTSTHIIVTQYNPPREIEYPIDRVQGVHLVVGIIPL